MSKVISFSIKKPSGTSAGWLSNNNNNEKKRANIITFSFLWLS